ncbi:O-methyltransferase [Azospirillum sp.]|uniref:O-methyltransferase n=1 Tax=Azospirillum sp. TaxID=34012 RepID=UPI002D572DF6|nr:O-methyltransferase [Azospirillum sp.]HYD64473.1 O-methyltransferase [Azospirillum sp.]
MSGGGIPYHLRANKHVDRQLFFEFLERYISKLDLESYGYATLGGPFLVDLKAAHARLGITDLLSIEYDDAVLSRQKFNKPISLIKCLKMRSGDFITDYSDIILDFEAKNWIIWLDYAAAAEREQQLSEVAALIGRLMAGDVVRITVNAAIHTLATREAYETTSAFQEAAFTRLQKQLGRFFPVGEAQPFSKRDMTLKGIARLLLSSIRIAVLEGLQGAAMSLRVEPISAFRYSDGRHQMLTVTLAIVDRKNPKPMPDTVENWPYFSGNWDDVREISIPDLSVQERMAIDQLLFSGSVKEISSKLPFKLDSKEAVCERLIQEYVDHYLRYPSFLQVSY